MRRNTSRYIAPAQKLDAGKSQHKNLTVVVPVAGIAHRMKSYGPKCLFHTSANSTIAVVLSNFGKVDSTVQAPPPAV